MQADGNGKHTAQAGMVNFHFLCGGVFAKITYAERFRCVKRCVHDSFIQRVCADAGKQPGRLSRKCRTREVSLLVEQGHKYEARFQSLASDDGDLLHGSLWIQESCERNTSLDQLGQSLAIAGTFPGAHQFRCDAFRDGCIQAAKGIFFIGANDQNPFDMPMLQNGDIDHRKRVFILQRNEISIQFRVVHHLCFLEPVRTADHSLIGILSVSGRDDARHSSCRRKHDILLPFAFWSHQRDKRALYGAFQGVHGQLRGYRRIQFRFQLLA